MTTQQPQLDDFSQGAIVAAFRAAFPDRPNSAIQIVPVTVTPWDQFIGILYDGSAQFFRVDAWARRRTGGKYSISKASVTKVNTVVHIP